jgi:hypothetical protein
LSGFVFDWSCLTFSLVSWYIDNGKVTIKLKEIIEQDDKKLSLPHIFLPSFFMLKGDCSKKNISRELAEEIPNNIFYGCKHYLRGCKILCPTCQKFFPCRVCHDKESDHELERRSVTDVFCYNCEHIVPIGMKCAECKSLFGSYYCDKCKLINGNPMQDNYHCDECLVYFFIVL